MASSPPGDESSVLPEGWTWSDVGHGALDVAGLVPIIGEAADLTNAAWLAAEGNYLDAGLSVVSMVPIVGDVVGKGGKLAKKGAGKLAGPALDALKNIDFKKMLEPLAKDPRIGPHVDKIGEALEKWRKELTGEAPCTPAGKQQCPNANLPAVRDAFKAHGYKGSPFKSRTGRQLVEALEAGGLSRERAIVKAEEMLQSGKALPEVVTLKKGQKLYKLSPGGASEHTPYWITEGQLKKLDGLSTEQKMSALGLPPESFPGKKGFVLEAITAKSDAVVFQSTIAPVSQGVYQGLGGAQQTLVPNRKLFGAAEKVVE